MNDFFKQFPPEDFEAQIEFYRQHPELRTPEAETPEDVARDLINLEHGITDHLTVTTIDFLMEWITNGYNLIFSSDEVWNLVFNHPRPHPDQQLWRVSRFPQTGCPSSFTKTREKVRNFLDVRPDADCIITCNLKDPGVRYYPLCDAVQTLRHLPDKDYYEARSWKIEQILDKAEVEHEYIVLETEDMKHISVTEF